MGGFWRLETRLDNLACWICRSWARQSHRSCRRHCSWLQKSDAFLASKSRRFRSRPSWLFCRPNYRKYRPSKFRWFWRSDDLQRTTHDGEVGRSSDNGLFFSNHRYVGILQRSTRREILETFAKCWTLDGAIGSFDAALDSYFQAEL